MSKLRGALRHRLLLEVDRLKPADRVTINKALAVAEEVHEKQYRPRAANAPAGEPHVVLPLSAALILIDELGVTDTNALCAALLADVLEMSDGGVTIASIEHEFGRNLALMVSIISRPKADPSIPRAKQMQVYHERLGNASIPTRLAKLAQRLALMREGAQAADLEYKQGLLAETRSVYLAIADDTDAYLHEQLIDLCDSVEAAIARAAHQ